MSDEAPRLRLKPRLAPDNPAQPPAVPVPPPATRPPPAPPAPVSSAGTPPPPIAHAAAPAAFRLKTKDPAAAPAPAPAAPPPAAPVSNLPLHTGRPAAVLAAENRRVQFAALCIGAAGAALFGVVGYLTYSGQLRAESLLFASDETEMAMDEPEEAMDEAPAAGADTAAPVVPPANEEPPPPPVVREAPVATTPSASPDVIEPGAAFRTAVAEFRILGVRGGAVPRILIAGDSYKAGDTVHAGLGIVFVGYDADRHLVRFRDATGAFIDRPDR